MLEEILTRNCDLFPDFYKAKHDLEWINSNRLADERT